MVQRDGLIFTHVCSYCLCTVTKFCTVGRYGMEKLLGTERLTWSKAVVLVEMYGAGA